MTRHARSNRPSNHPVRALPFAAALTFAVSGAALAQGTPEQRQACAADAVELCSDTIPDVAKTTACMKAHFAKLSPRCKIAFNSATEGGPPAGSRREERAAREAPEERAGGNPGYPEDDIPGVRHYRYVAPEPYGAADDGLDTSRSVISGLCEQGMIDPGTCRRTARALHMDR